VIFRDVTEQKRAEAKIHEAVRLRDQFLAMLSHELRNPLGAIVTATAMLKQNSADGHDRRRSARRIAIVERQSLQMARLLDDLLEASRVHAEQDRVAAAGAGPATIAAEAADAVRASWRAAAWRSRRRCPTSRCSSTAIPRGLQQIQVNLLSNAAKYTPRGGHVRFSGRRDGADAVIRVRDDGAGLPPRWPTPSSTCSCRRRRTLDRAAGGPGVG
jgi:two-component system CheB/CheR fusion protein